MQEEANIPHCNFCGKHKEDVQFLIAGPMVFICDECVCLCCNFIAQAWKNRAAAIDKGIVS